MKKQATGKRSYAAGKRSTYAAQSVDCYAAGKRSLCQWEAWKFFQPTSMKKQATGKRSYAAGKRSYAAGKRSSNENYFGVIVKLLDA